MFYKNYVKIYEKLFYMSTFMKQNVLDIKLYEQLLYISTICEKQVLYKLSPNI